MVAPNQVFNGVFFHEEWTRLSGRVIQSIPAAVSNSSKEPAGFPYIHTYYIHTYIHLHTYIQKYRQTY